MPASSHRVWSIPSLLLKVGIPKSICGCILGCKVLCIIFGVTLTLPSCLSRPRIIVSLAYLSKFRVWMHYGVVDCSVPFTVTLTSDFGLLKLCVDYISYTTWHRNPILGIHVGVMESCILFWVTVTLTAGLKT